MEKTLNDNIKCGKIMVFDSLLAKNRKAFCIDLNEEESIVYRGFCGLKWVSKKVFLNFAKVKDIYDYELPLEIVDMFALKRTYMINRRSLFKNNKTVCAFVKDLYSKRNL